VTKARLPLDAYHGIIAATNFKQRVRKMMEYYYADCLNFAVMGTPNRLEYDQGFFVKNRDGSADVKPIAHLYKTQTYQLAEYLGIPEDIRSGFSLALHTSGKPEGRALRNCLNRLGHHQPSDH
jgi:NAD+ synthase